MKIREKKVIQGLILFSILIVAILSFFGDKGLWQYMELRDQETQLKQDIEELKLERKNWMEKIESLKTNKNYMETLARERLGMVHNTEIMIQLHHK